MHYTRKPLNWNFRILLIAGFFFLIMMPLLAQQQDLVLKEELLSFNEKRLDINRWGMMTLGSWAVGNMIINPFLIAGSEGRSRYFYTMNVGWNAVNLALAGFGLYSALTTDPESFSWWESIQEQNRMEKILLFNAALDLGYMAAGWAMIERGRRVDNRGEMLQGFGQSLILQGAFLFAFDLAMVMVHSRHAGQVMPELFEQFSLAFYGSGAGICFRF